MVNGEGSSVNTRNKSNKNNTPATSATPKHDIKSMDQLFSAVAAIRETVAAIHTAQEILSSKFDELSSRQSRIEQENETVNSLQFEQANLH